MVNHHCAYWNRQKWLVNPPCSDSPKTPWSIHQVTGFDDWIMLKHHVCWWNPIKSQLSLIKSHWIPMLMGELPLNLYFHCSDIPFKSPKIAIFPAILAPLAHQGLIQACHEDFDKVAMFLGKEIGRIATVGRWFIPLQYLYTYQLVQEFFHPQFFRGNNRYLATIGPFIMIQ